MSRARKTGNIVSGVGHVGFITWILFGGLFTSRPEPVEFREAAMVSGEEFQALVDAARQPVIEAPEAVPAAPEVTEDAPEVDVAVPEPVAPQPPAEVAEPAQEPVEDLAPDVSDAAPERPEPPAEVNVEEAPVAQTPVERPAEIVAPEPAPRPAPEAVQEPEPQEAVIPEDTGETVEQPQEAVQTPEASNRILTEAAEAPASSPNASLRPPARRPSAPRPAEVAETPAPSAPAPSPEQQTVDEAAVQAALEAALSSATNTVPTGPPMSSGEKDTLRLAVQGCWNVDPGARWAQTTVTVAMNMTQDGRVVPSSLRMVASEGGDAATANAAFGAARRAILLCEREGYPLPPEKFGQWQEIEMTFNPERMRIR
jgi:hypothetical protein